MHGINVRKVTEQKRIRNYFRKSRWFMRKAGRCTVQLKSQEYSIRILWIKLTIKELNA